MSRKRKPSLIEIEFEMLDKRIDEMLQNVKAYEYGDCRIISGHSEKMGFYMSVSCRKRFPTFDEIFNITSRLVVGKMQMAILIPDQIEPEKFTLNIHQVAVPEFIDVQDAEGKRIGVERTNEN